MNKTLRIVSAILFFLPPSVALAGPLTDGPSSPLANLNLPGFIHDCTLSNDASAPNTVIDIGNASPGVQKNTGCWATSSDYTTLMVQTAAFTKSLASTWAVGSGNGGLDIGGVLASTWYHVYQIERLDTGNADYLISQAPGLSRSVTCTNASPMVCTWGGATPVAVEFQNGAPFQFTAGTAPTGFSLNTTYFVVALTVPATGQTTFELSSTQGGTAGNSTSTGSGLTGTLNPVLPANYTVYRRIGSIKTDASSHILAFTQIGDHFTPATEVQDVTSLAPGNTSPHTAILPSIPIGVNVVARLNVGGASSSNDARMLVFPMGTTAAINNFNTGAEMAAATSGIQGWSYLEVQMNTAEQVQYLAATSGGSVFMTIIGWTDPR
jgi:hypothetical protein